MKVGRQAADDNTTRINIATMKVLSTVDYRYTVFITDTDKALLRPFVVGLASTHFGGVSPESLGPLCVFMRSENRK